jgi:hypothetical protein
MQPTTHLQLTVRCRPVAAAHSDVSCGQLHSRIRGGGLPTRQLTGIWGPASQQVPAPQDRQYMQVALRQLAGMGQGPARSWWGPGRKLAARSWGAPDGSGGVGGQLGQQVLREAAVEVVAPEAGVPIRRQYLHPPLAPSAARRLAPGSSPGLPVMLYMQIRALPSSRVRGCNDVSHTSLLASKFGVESEQATVGCPLSCQHRQPPTSLSQNVCPAQCDDASPRSAPPLAAPMTASLHGLPRVPHAADANGCQTCPRTPDSNAGLCRCASGPATHA